MEKLELQINGYIVDLNKTRALLRGETLRRETSLSLVEKDPNHFGGHFLIEYADYDCERFIEAKFVYYEDEEEIIIDILSIKKSPLNPDIISNTSVKGYPVDEELEPGDLV